MVGCDAASREGGSACLTSRVTLLFVVPSAPVSEVHNVRMPRLRDGHASVNTAARRLIPPIDNLRDHILGPLDAGITLVEQGS